MTVRTLTDLDGRLFVDVPEAAALLGRDERVVRRACAAGDIPGRRVGVRWVIPVAWLREQAGGPVPPAAAAGPDLDELADRVADRVFARLAQLFGARAASGPGESA